MIVSVELDSFLSKNTRTMLVMLRRDGSPTIYPMLGLWRDGALWFNTYRRSAKMRNIERDPRVCAMVLSGQDELTPPAVVMRGKAEILEPGTTIPTVPAGGSGISRPAGVTDGIVTKVADRVASAKRVLFRVAPDELRMLA